MPEQPLSRSRAAGDRRLVVLQVALLCAAVALLSSAGSATWLLGATAGTGSLTLLLRCWSPPATRTELVDVAAVAWLIAATPIVGAELMGVVGRPGSRAILALGLVWAISATVAITMLRSATPGAGSRTVRWISRTFAAVAGGFGALLLAEIALRQIDGPRPYAVVPEAGSPPRLFAPDPVVGLRLTPGFHGRYVHPEFDGQRVMVNEQGHRDRPWTEELLANSERRVLLLGDSFVFGTGVEIEDTLGRQLEILADGNGERTVVYNAGVPGHAPPHAAILLDSLAAHVDPHVVVIAMFMGNDPADALRLVDQDFAGRARGIPAALLTGERIHADLLFRRARSVDYWFTGSRIGKTLLSGIAHHLVRAGVIAPILNYSEFELRTWALEPDPDAAAALAACESGIARAQELCRSSGRKLLVLLVPSIGLVDATMFDRIFALRRLHRAAFSPDVLHDRLRRFAAGRDLPLCDLLPAFRAAHANGALLYHQEGHWNAAGHRAAARALLAELRGRGWL